ncbi:MAG: radical SAM protein [Candidatus Woesearchaeota archaeon]
MKTLLVYPKTYYRRDVPLSLAYIGAVLKESGHNVRVHDPAPYEKLNLLDTLKQFEPEVVCFTCNTINMVETLRMLDIVKEWNPHTKTILGGPHPSSMPGETLSYKNVDFIVIGEGEETIKELVSELEKKNTDFSKIKGIGFKTPKLKFTERRPLIENLDSLPFPDRDMFPMKWYTQTSTSIRGQWLSTVTLMTSRGCPYNCAFCASKSIWGRSFRTHSAGRVIEELEFVLEKYRVDAVKLIDDTFYVDKKRILQICNEIKNRKLDFVWAAQARTDLQDEEIMKSISESGCIQLAFGVESGSNKVLKAMNKLNMAENAVPAFKLCKKYGIRTIANFMLGNPEEEIEDVEMTRRLAHELDADYVDFYITTPFPGTPLYEQAKKNGWIKKGTDFSKYKIDLEPIMEINFSMEEIKKIRNALKKEFVGEKVFYFLRNPKFLKDAALIGLLNPALAPKIIVKYLKTLNVEDSLREFERTQRMRRFP